jgi:hypothetical protein
VFQLLLFRDNDVGVAVISVLPARVSVTVTVTPVAGAALSRMLDVPLAPLATFNVAGLATMDGVVVPPWIVNGTDADDVLAAGVALSNAVACAVWFPDARPVALKL